MELWEAVKRYDQKDMAAEELAAFKVCCAYQLDNNPDLTLHPAFRRAMKAPAITNGEAATIAPFMVTMKALFCALLLAAPAYAGTLAPLVDLRAAIEGLWVQPSQFQQTGKPRFIRFVVLPAEYSASAMLEISLTLPEGHSPDAVAYRLTRDGKEWTAENYAYRNGEHYTVYLPDLQKDERVEFSLGWELRRLNIMLWPCLRLASDKKRRTGGAGYSRECSP